MISVRNGRGFTLIEALLASIILCGAALAVGAITVRSLSDTKLNRQYEAAMALIDKQLTLINYMGIEDFIELGQMEGEVEESDLAYRWKVITEFQGTDNLYRVNITARWVERKRPYSVSVDTMFNGSGAVAGPASSLAPGQ